jgi:dTDP-4-dehydrorhamnose reductase
MSPFVLAAAFARERPLRCIVLGAAGQLGRALHAARLGEGQPVIGLTRTDLDVVDRQAVISALTDLRPDLVINAVAYTAVDQAESEPARAFAVNRDGAANVAQACASLDVPMIHVSTDYVFDGQKIEPYREEDEPAPLSVYGLSKAEGERLVRDRHDRCAIIRTSWLFGVDGHNFVKTIVKLARDRDELRVVADQRGCPTPAADLASVIFAISRAMLADRTVSGLYHFAGAEAISWHGFAEAVVQQIAPRLPHRPRLIPIGTKDYPTPARRPRNSVLDCGKLAQLGIGQKSWRPGLRTVINQLLQSDASRLTAIPRSMPCPIFS